MDFGLLAKEYGTPLYVYNADQMHQKIRAILDIPYRPMAVHFASMCNSTPGILDFFLRHHIKLFVNSPKHLFLGLDVGFAPEEIIFTGTNLNDSDFEAVIRTGVTLNVDSLGQLDAYCRANPGGAVGLRVNFDFRVPANHGGVFIGHESRIGIFEAEFAAAKQIAARSGVKLNGVHAYLGTDIMNVQTFIQGTAEVLRLARHFPDLEYVDLGGGFGIPSRLNEGEFPIAEYKHAIAGLMTAFAHETGRPVKLVLEPGRWLIADSGYLLTRVVDVKSRENRTYIGTDATVSIFPRPLLYEDAYHEVTVWNKEHAAPQAVPACICGNTTYSRDYLAKDRFLPQVTAGDLLVLHNAGGYSVSVITDFLGRLRPAEVLVENGQVQMLRPRETIQRLDKAALHRKG